MNLFAVLMFAGGILYLDSFRVRLLEQRQSEMRGGAFLVAAAIKDNDSPARTRELVRAAGEETGVRVRIYNAAGQRTLDSWSLMPPTYRLVDPHSEPWQFRVARALDRIIEGAVFADRLPYLDTSLPDSAATFPEIAAALETGAPSATVRLAPDRTPIIYSAAPIDDGDVLTMSVNDRDLTQVVRDERETLFYIFLGVLGLTLFVSSFLARTIVRPLRRLALAAQRVRLGRSREVTVPRFRTRRDEIGELARSLADMTAALRSRIDATEAFAADVAHELKNPLAAIRSAVEGMDHARDEEQREQLMEIVRSDVDRVERLVRDISEASRLDAELSRARFEPVDLARMVDAIAELDTARGLPRGITLDVETDSQALMVMGEDSRLAQVVRNLLDNAISFSPDGGRVRISATGAGRRVTLRVEDEGPGIPAGAEEKIFARFYSERPEHEGFGQHSGLGLAIVRAIVEAHDGTIRAEPAESGARFLVELPAA